MLSLSQPHQGGILPAAPRPGARVHTDLTSKLLRDTSAAPSRAGIIRLMNVSYDVRPWVLRRSGKEPGDRVRGAWWRGDDNPKLSGRHHTRPQPSVHPWVEEIVLLHAVDTPPRQVTAVIELDARYTSPPKAIRQSARVTERARKKVEDGATRRRRRRGNLLGGRCLTPGEKAGVKTQI